MIHLTIQYGTDETDVWNEADGADGPNEADEGAGALVAARAG
jgi:hypothetical protein